MTRPHDLAREVRLHLTTRRECEQLQVFVNVITGSISWAAVATPLAARWFADRDHIMAGTYDRHATEQRIHADLLQAREDAELLRRHQRPQVIHSTGGGWEG